MGEELSDSDPKLSKMFIGKNGTCNPDEELAINIIHRFNICKETLDTMPAFEEHLNPLFFNKKEK